MQCFGRQVLQIRPGINHGGNPRLEHKISIAIKASRRGPVLFPQGIVRQWILNEQEQFMSTKSVISHQWQNVFAGLARSKKGTSKSWSKSPRCRLHA